ncbi:hypothetical protein FRX31_017134 [Thalictrum thalictroides]|uniref:CAND6/7 N-terminal domain-containing protein n=1 Tax=Thalictrum thalictroides TaxID=46969 RepID=A0A7J6W772_THATH|nr:hypothetical protein FRX31_017134 [Thalictrum thalictroides]
MVMLSSSSSCSPGLVTSAVLVLVIIISCFTSIAFADTYTFNNIGHNKNYLQFLDDFWFTKAQGQIQLNVSNISFSNPNPASDSFNLSQIAFFLVPRNYTTLHACALNQSLIPPKILYTFDKLVQPTKNLTTKTSFHLLVTDLDTYDDNVYDLYFQNCNSPNQNLTLSMNVQTSMPGCVVSNMPITDDDEKLAYESLNTSPDRYLRYMTGLNFQLPEP